MELTVTLIVALLTGGFIGWFSTYLGYSYNTKVFWLITIPIGFINGLF